MKTYIVANWKMYLNAEESFKTAEHIKANLTKRDDVELIVCPNALAFNGVRDILKDAVSYGAQNVAWTPLGAYTGAISALLFYQDGARYALVGHSERRYIFGEDNEAVRKKMNACIDTGLIPILCIGETHDDKEEEKQEYRIKKQLMKALEGLDLQGIVPLVAYEPVWAISNFGIGQPCDPEYANNMHAVIKKELTQYSDADIPVLYGGSVDNNNIASYVSRENINGVLVGSASTNGHVLLDLLDKGAQC